MNKSTAEILQTFLNFFHSKGHQIIASSSLIPKKDPSLLFTNAGMNQFKNIFLGLDKCDYSRVTTAQRCIRISGKHNDLEKVGYTAYHHTFFEMLGNFSFGDYFKQDAIKYAWELLTSKNWFNLPKERFWITVYETDDESYEIWKKEIGISQEQIIRVGDNEGTPYVSDNFWQMGVTGPCGPCTEIFYDHGNILENHQSNFKKNNDRYVEIWNIVFIQFNRRIDGNIEPLLKYSIDTGMGLERITAVLQHVNSSYDIDMFRMLIKSIAKIIGVGDLQNKSLRIIADHIRSCAFLIADGVIPSNESRGYVLRRIIRRAARHGKILGAKNIFLYKLINPLIEVMGKTSEYLKIQKNKIEQILKNEEKQFTITLERGLVLLNEELTKIKDNTLDGETAFYLYDTYGLPIDLTSDICYERSIKIDKVGFELAMEKQRNLARKSSNFNIDYNSIIRINKTSKFLGYDNLKLNNSIVIALFVNGKEVDNINCGQEAIVILNETPFYAESGGQIGDKGELRNNSFDFKVNDTQKYGQAIGHIGKLISGCLKIGENVQASVNEVYRARICLNHSATHLMHAALSTVLNDYIVQKGSLINDKILRFDFSYFKAMRLTEIRAVEDLVNEQIRLNLPVEASITDLETAKNRGALTLFNKKYNKDVRILTIGNFSIELCGGTHVSRTGNIGLFSIISESSIAAGIRRIEAVTGENAIDNFHEQRDRLYNISRLLKANNSNLITKVNNIIEHTYKLEKELHQLKEYIVLQKSVFLSSKAVETKGVKLLIKELKNIEPKMFGILIDNLKNRLGSTIIILATIVKEKVFITAGVSKDVTDRVKAVELIKILAQQINGKGGGSSEIAHTGGTNLVALPTALANIKNWISTKL